MFETPARNLAARIGARDSILDVGAGAGVWSLAMAETSPAAQVTAVDGPRVLEVLRGWAAERGLEDRVACTPGDMHDGVWEPERFDRVVVANVLHLEPEERALPLLERCARSLRPTGELVVIDCMADASWEQQLTAAVYTLHLGIRVTDSEVHPEARLRHWFEEVGLSSVERVGLEGMPSGAALIGRAA